MNWAQPGAGVMPFYLLGHIIKLKGQKRSDMSQIFHKTRLLG